MVLPEHKHFYFVHGKKAGTIEDLKEIIKGISETQFKHHVTSKKNDFANWVRDVLDKKELAEKLEKVNSKEETLKILEKEKTQVMNYSQEFRRFIVKEFIYGMLFGLIIGFIIGKLVV